MTRPNPVHHPRARHIRADGRFSLWSGIADGNRSATMYLRALVHLIVLAIVLSQFANWLEAGVPIVGSLVVEELQASPHEVAEKFMAMSASASDEADGGF